MRSIFHKHVPSFSFSSSSSSNNNNSTSNDNNNNNNNNKRDDIQSHSQPNSPTQKSQNQRSQSSNPPLPELPHSSIGISFSEQSRHQQQQQEQSGGSSQLTVKNQPYSLNNSNLHRKRLLNKSFRSSEPIYIGLSPSDPLQLMRIDGPQNQSDRPQTPGISSNQSTATTASSVTTSSYQSNSPAPVSALTVNNNESSSAYRRRSTSLVESLAESIASPPTSTSQTAAQSSSILSRHRRRWSNFFNNSASPHRSQSPSPTPYLVKLRHRRSPSSKSYPEEPKPRRRRRGTNSSSVRSEDVDVEEAEVEEDGISVGSSEQDQGGTEEESVTEEEEGEDEDGDDGENETDDEGDDEDDDEDDEANKTILANTNANSSSMTPIDYLQSSDQPIPFIDQAPNLTSPPPPPISFTSNAAHKTAVLRKNSSLKSNSSLRGRRSGSLHQTKLKLQVSRPIYERNRCTIAVENGDRSEAAEKAERTRFYLVACDLSEESKYAIEWTIGTVLRQGDECLIIMVMETETKFDPEDGGSQADKTAKIRNQKERQEKATSLVREATLLLERTRLNVRVTCQALHAKNAKHLLVDCIDFLEPNLVIVGSRGVNNSGRPLPGTGVLGSSAMSHGTSTSSSAGFLMGSVSNYLVHKSSVPVMVARRKLRAPIKVYSKKPGTIRGARTKLEEAAIESVKNSTGESVTMTGKDGEVKNEEGSVEVGGGAMDEVEVESLTESETLSVKGTETETEKR